MITNQQQQTILLRVVSPLLSSSNDDITDDEAKKTESTTTLPTPSTTTITFIQISPSTTVRQACIEALKAFSGTSSNNKNDDDNDDEYSLIIETGRMRVIDQQTQQITSMEGQLSMALDPSWLLLPYILGEWFVGGDIKSRRNNNSNNTSTAAGKSQKTMVMKNNDDDDDHYNNNDIDNMGDDDDDDKDDLPLGTTSYMQKRVAPWSVVGYLIKKQRKKTTSKFSPLNRQGVPAMPGCCSQAETTTMTTTTTKELPERLQQMTNSMKPGTFSE